MKLTQNKATQWVTSNCIKTTPWGPQCKILIRSGFMSGTIYYFIKKKHTKKSILKFYTQSNFNSTLLFSLNHFALHGNAVRFPPIPWKNQMLHCPYISMDQHLTVMLKPKSSFNDLCSQPLPSKKQASFHNYDFFSSLYSVRTIEQTLFGYLHTKQFTYALQKKFKRKKWNAKQFKIPIICVTSNLVKR